MLQMGIALAIVVTELPGGAFKSSAASPIWNNFDGKIFEFVLTTSIGAKIASIASPDDLRETSIGAPLGRPKSVIRGTGHQAAVQIIGRRHSRRKVPEPCRPQRKFVSFPNPHVLIVSKRRENQIHDEISASSAVAFELNTSHKAPPGLQNSASPR
jgi:hypothetical protein